LVGDREITTHLTTDEEAIMKTTQVTHKTTTKTPVKTFRDLRTWQSAYDLAVAVYRQCETFPKHEQYGLVSQMTRAAVSVCSNIAEGFGRRTYKEKDQFFGHAHGSLTELENQLLIARGVGYINTAQYEDLARRSDSTHWMLLKLQKINREWAAAKELKS